MPEGYIYCFTGGATSLVRAFETLPDQGQYCTSFVFLNKKYSTITSEGGMRICGIYENGTKDDKMSSMYRTLSISTYTYLMVYCPRAVDGGAGFTISK